MELGIYTFGDVVPDPRTGRKVSQTERMTQVIEMARLADELGLDVFALGEHHTPNFILSATATALAAVAAVTKTIRLTSAVTLISTADPVRTYQEFATADLVSNGRIELILGRGAFTEGFPLFGYDLEDYDALFVEKVELFERLNSGGPVTWSGKFRSPLVGADVAPRPAQPRLPVWIGALSPESVARAATLGLPLAMPLLGGTVPGYARLADLYRQVWARAGRDPEAVRVAGFSHFNIAETAVAARDEYHPYYTAFFAHLSGRGGIPRPTFDQMSGPDGVLTIGSPQEIIDRLMGLHERVGLSRYLGQIDIGGQPFARIARAIELLATEVAPVIRRETARVRV
jgi:alkanesulfonate monooxygenase SsuD/methylene tetrahydromethanopterin reductase-like flavin-dependent oxidoreductase (luciferase family)